MSVSSYGTGTTSSGTIVIEKDIEVKIDGRDIIIVEDIVDTGLTLTHVYRILSEKGARSIRVAHCWRNPVIRNTSGSWTMSASKFPTASLSVTVSISPSGIATFPIFGF